MEKKFPSQLSKGNEKVVFSWNGREKNLFWRSTLKKCSEDCEFTFEKI